MVTLTTEWIEKGMTSGIGMKRTQCEVLGIEYPLKKGWKQTLIGKEVSESQLIKFIELGLSSKKENKNKSHLNNSKKEKQRKTEPLPSTSDLLEVEAYHVEPKSFYDLDLISADKLIV